MDSIDITDLAFSLGMPDVNNDINADGNLTDYTMFIYIGVAILVAFIGLFVWKFYINKNVNETQDKDCSGGFCTMSSSNASQI